MKPAEPPTISSATIGTPRRMASATPMISAPVGSAAVSRPIWNGVALKFSVPSAGSTAL